MSHLFWDEDFVDHPELLNKRKRVNRIRYQQVKEALKHRRKYRHKTFEQVADDFDLSERTVRKINKTRTFGGYRK